MICTNDTLFLNSFNQLRSLGLVNNYTSRLFCKVFRKFVINDHPLPDQFIPDNEKDTCFEKCFVKIPYVGIESKWFANRLSELVKRQFGTSRTSRYF